MTRSEGGFTLIELLVVILIIGVLAAIALPAYIDQRGKSHDAEAKLLARTAQVAAETFYVNEIDYSPATAAAQQDIEPALLEGQGPTLAVGGTGLADYTVATHVEDGDRVLDREDRRRRGPHVRRPRRDRLPEHRPLVKFRDLASRPQSRLPITGLASPK